MLVLILILILILALVATSVAWLLSWRACNVAIEGQDFALDGWSKLISQLPQRQRKAELSKIEELINYPKEAISGPEGEQASRKQIRNQKLLQRLTLLAESQIETEPQSLSVESDANKAGLTGLKDGGSSPFPWGDTWSRPQ